MKVRVEHKYSPVTYDSRKVHVGDIIYLPFRGEKIAVRFCADGFWRDGIGCIYGFIDDKTMTDKVVRCGVYPFALPANHPLSSACAPHDYAYSCPAYQVSHTREETDEKLERDLEIIAKGHWYDILVKPFYWIARNFGGRYWENDKTNN